MLQLWIANGVTTIRGMFAQPYHLELRSLIAGNEVLGPRLYTAGPSLNGSSVKTVEQAVAKVSEQAAAGYDFVKMHPGLTLENYDAIAETAKTSALGPDMAVWTAIASPSTTRCTASCCTLPSIGRSTCGCRLMLINGVKIFYIKYLDTEFTKFNSITTNFKSYEDK